MALRDLKVKTTVVLGGTRLPIGEIVKMGRGAIIKLDESVDSPSLLHVNGAPLASGTIEVDGDRISLRIVDVLAKAR